MIQIYCNSICPDNQFIQLAVKGLTGDTRKIFVLKTVDESNWAHVLVGCKSYTIKGIILTGTRNFKRLQAATSHWFRLTTLLRLATLIYSGEFIYFTRNTSCRSRSHHRYQVGWLWYQTYRCHYNYRHCLIKQIARSMPQFKMKEILNLILQIQLRRNIYPWSWYADIVSTCKINMPAHLK